MTDEVEKVVKTFAEVVTQVVDNIIDIKHEGSHAAWKLAVFTESFTEWGARVDGILKVKSRMDKTDRKLEELEDRINLKLEEIKRIRFNKLMFIGCLSAVLTCLTTCGIYVLLVRFF